MTKLSGVFRVGELEPAFAEELAARYDVPRLPDGAARDRFLAEDAAEVRALLTWDGPGWTPP